MRELKTKRGGLVGGFNALCETNLPWGPHRSLLIGCSAACYLVPAIVDRSSPRALVWIAQAIACFWSDFIDAGRWGLSHLVDRALAPTLVLYVIKIALHERGFFFVVKFAIPTFLCFGLSASCRKKGDAQGYAIFHSLWHLISASVATYTLSHEYRHRGDSFFA